MFLKFHTPDGRCVYVDIIDGLIVEEGDRHTTANTLLYRLSKERVLSLRETAAEVVYWIEDAVEKIAEQGERVCILRSDCPRQEGKGEGEEEEGEGEEGDPESGLW